MFSDFKEFDEYYDIGILLLTKQYPIISLVTIFIGYHIYKKFKSKENLEIEKIPKSFFILENAKINGDLLHDKLLDNLLKTRCSELPNYQDWIVNLFKSEIHFLNELSIPKDIENKEKYKNDIIKNFIKNFSNFFDDQILDFIKKKHDDLGKREKVTYDDAYLYIKMLKTLATPNYLDKILDADDEKKLMKKYLDNARSLLT
jgi:hypothetical protein